jgi:hypothetical protein
MEEFDTYEVDDRSYEDDESDWCRHPPRRVEGKRSHRKHRGNDNGGSKGGSYIAGVSEWPRRTPTTGDYHNREDEMSVIDSVAESGGSGSLGAIEQERDVMVAMQELERMREMIVCGELKRRTALKE